MYPKIKTRSHSTVSLALGNVNFFIFLLLTVYFVTRELIETLFRPFRLLELRALRTLLSLFSLGLLGRLSVRDDTARDVLSLSFTLGFSF